MQHLRNIAYGLCFLMTVEAQSSAADLTQCGLACELQSIPAAGCSLTDIACQCSNKQLATISSRCLLANCTMHDTLIVAKVQASLCQFQAEDKSGLIRSVFIASVTIAVVFVGVRMVSKPCGGNRLGLEDWIILVALVLLSVPITFTFRMADEGFGKHLFSLRDGQLLEFLRSFYIAENFYVVNLALTKLSILAFYIRIFQHQKWFRYSVFATAGMIVLSTTIISILTIFQCRPIRYFWNKDIKGGSCLDVTSLAYANTAMSMIQDVIVVVLPIPIVTKMNMNKKKKRAVYFMFGMGGFGCVVSGIRLRSLLAFGNSIDPSWDFIYVVIWTAVELLVAVVCSCLPELRNLLGRVYPKGLLSTTRSKSRENDSPFDSASKRPKVLQRDNIYIELNDDLTKITVHGEEIEYPRRSPAVPKKEICRAPDGRFYDT